MVTVVGDRIRPPGSLGPLGGEPGNNIGHFLVGEAIFSGLESAIRRMRSLMDKARAEAGGERSA